MWLAPRCGVGLNALLGRAPPIPPSAHDPPDSSATDPAPEAAHSEALTSEERCSRANGKAHQDKSRNETPNSKTSILGLSLAAQLSLSIQIRLQNSLRDCFGLLLFHVPRLLISGLTPKLSRDAKRRRLERLVGPLLATGQTPLVGNAKPRRLRKKSLQQDEREVQ